MVLGVGSLCWLSWRHLRPTLLASARTLAASATIPPARPQVPLKLSTTNWRNASHFPPIRQREIVADIISVGGEQSLAHQGGKSRNPLDYSTAQISHRAP